MSVTIITTDLIKTQRRDIAEPQKPTPVKPMYIL